MCHRRKLSIVQLENFTKFYSFRMCLTLLSSVHEVKCETSLNLNPRNPTSTFHNGYGFGAPFSKLSLKFYYAPLCKSSQYLKGIEVSIPSALAK